ncbi:MAG: class I SAM-dependent methyltransferase [Thermoproteota archaeon]
MSGYLHSVKELLSKPEELPSFIVEQCTTLVLRMRSHEAIIQMLNNFTQFSEAEIREKYQEFKNLGDFIQAVSNPRSIIGAYGIPEQAVAAYLMVRLLKPKNVVETGVASGNSSACILKALELNGKGVLYSIDLPGTEKSPVIDPSTPYKEAEVYKLEDESKIGWRVPDSLKENWTLQLGSSKELLDPLLERLEQVDVFLHDSRHSYQNMTWEYRKVLPHLSPEGIIISDDVDWNTAFQDFTSKNELPCDSLLHYLSTWEMNGGKFPEQRSRESLSILGIFRQKEKS